MRLGVDIWRVTPLRATFSGFAAALGAAFWALEAITGENPVPAADRGKVQKMADAWVAWGREQGLIH